MSSTNPLAPAETIAPGGGSGGAAFPYRIEALVGEGSMGVVYRAIEPTLGRPVAIKLLKADPAGTVVDDAATAEKRLRFLQEARSAAAIQHPGAVTIYRAGEAGGRLYIAMEWLEGETLAARLARVGRLEIAEAVDLALQTLETLQAAHDAGVIHRDVKPSNLVLRSDGRVKVADFGIAQFRGADLLRTEIGVMLGTPAYAAPEQLRGEVVDARSDLFSLGTVLYEALTGRMPFTASNLLELATKMLRDTPTPLGALRPDLPAGVVQVVSRALAKDRAARWSSAREMAAALRSSIATPAVVAVSPPLPESWPGSTIAPPRGGSGVVYRGLPAQLPLALAHLVCSWPAQSVPLQPLERLLLRLLDRPLHAPAFSGGLAFGGRLLLLSDGKVLGAIERRTGEHGNGVVDELAQSVTAQIHPVPDDLPRRTIEVLAGLLGTTRMRQAGLDSSIVHLPGLAQKLAADQFDGVILLHREGGEGRLVLVGGRNVLSFFSGGWDDIDLQSDWTTWVGHLPLGLEVEEVVSAPLDLTWSLRLRDFELLCDRKGGSSQTSRGSGGLAARRLRLLASRLEPQPASLAVTPTRELEPGIEGWREAPAARLLDWLLTEGSAHFSEPKIAARWKYLAEWLPLVRRARLYSDLADGERGDGARFDLATFDEEGKILHLAQTFPRLTAKRFRQALEGVVQEKEARRAGGDIGGVVFAAPEFPPDIVSLYLDSIERSTSGLRRLQESVTGYAGFVRVGPRRGFHLLLVEERPNGFAPLDV